MKLWLVKKRRLLMFSLAVIAINLVTLRFLAADDIEKVNLAELAGRQVAIDPGHGGIDDGASGNGATEKKINLAVAGKLADILTANGAGVVMTRTGDIDYYTRGRGGKRNDLMKRVAIITESGAELFVSIHCNAINSAELKGAQVFYSPKQAANKPLAEIMQRALKNFPPGNKRQAKQDLQILLLNAVTNTPGVMVEIGYLTNKQEAALLQDDSYQQKLAEHIARALAYHFSHNVER